MSLEKLRALEAARPAQPSRICSVRMLLERIPDEEAEVIRGWLDLPVHELGHQRISADIEAVYDVQITNITIGRHRRGDCQCRRNS